MVDINTTCCCGLKEINGIIYSKPKDTIRTVLEDQIENESHPPFYIFTGVTKEKYGNKLEKYIKKYKLGTIIKTHSKRNPNSENFITIWTWEINNQNLKKWGKKRKLEIHENNEETEDDKDYF